MCWGGGGGGISLAITGGGHAKLSLGIGDKNGTDYSCWSSERVKLSLLIRRRESNCARGIMRGERIVPVMGGGGYCP